MAAAAPSAAPTRVTAVFPRTYRKFQITNLAQWGGWGAPGPGRGSCGIPGDSGVPHPWTAGGWPFPGPYAPTCLSSAPHTPEDCPRRSELRSRPPRHALRGAEPCGGPGPARGQRPAGAPGLATTHAVWLWAGHVTSLCLGLHPWKRVLGLRHNTCATLGALRTGSLLPHDTAGNSTDSGWRDARAL